MSVSARAVTTTAIVLAGGRSSRMGRDKALLDWHGRSLLEHVVGRLDEVVDEVLVVVDVREHAPSWQERIVVDEVQGAGPLGGLHAGLGAALGSACFVCSCDAPGIEPRLVQHLLEQLDRHEAAVPVTASGIQPLVAAYRASVAEQVAARLARGELALRGLVNSLDDVLLVEEPELRRHDPDLASFVNLNTPLEYERARRMGPA